MCPHYSAHPTYPTGTPSMGPLPLPNVSTHSIQHWQSPISAPASSHPVGNIYMSHTMPLHIVQSPYGRSGPILLPCHALPALASAGIFHHMGSQLSTTCQITEFPAIDPTTYVHGIICTPSPWHDPPLTHPSLTWFTLIVTNHESPPWSFPETDYLPDDHHLQHRLDSSGNS